MLPTFVIGLREGLEASLIVGIIAAFLRRQGRRDLMRWVLLGVAAAIALCAAGAVALAVVSADLPQRQQEALETVIGVVAVAMVTSMVVWMKRHARELRGQLESAAGAALAGGSGWALVLMAFLAVLREGFETAVFLVAAFNGASSRGAAGGGAVLGVAVAVLLGYGIYRGGVRLDLSRFFRVTGLVLVLVAAGLVQTALRTAHEAGWLDVGQGTTIDLSAVVAPGSVQSALITGMLGLQPEPRLIELVGWLLYLVPVGLYVAWPAGRAPARRTVTSVVAAGAVVAGLAAGLVVVLAPAAPAPAGPTTAVAVVAGGGTTSGPVTVDQRGDTLRVNAFVPATGEVGAPTTLAAPTRGTSAVGGVASDVHAATLPVTTRTDVLTYAQLAARGGGRLPLGLRSPSDTGPGAVAVTETVRTTVTTSVARASGRLADVVWTSTVTLVARGAAGPVALTAAPVTGRLAPDAAATLLADARSADAALAARASARDTATVLAVVAGVLLLVAAGLVLAGRRRAAPAAGPVASAAGAATAAPSVTPAPSVVPTEPAAPAATTSSAGV